MRAIQLVVAGVLVVSFASSAHAQPLGTFRWQLQPYCNVISLAVTQNGSVYRLEGTDDQCGAGTAASTTGTAFLNPDGTIGLGMAIVSTPGGTPVHLDATLTLPSLGGTWRDSAGRSGSFVFTPGPSTGGSPRPAGGIGAAAVDPAQVQLRVASCGAGSAVRVVNQDGSVVCEPAGGDMTSVTPGPGLTGGATTGAATLAVDFAGSGSAGTVARSDHNHGTVQFRADGFAAQTIPNGLVTPVSGIAAVSYNDGGGTYTPATGTYVIPVSGIYTVSASVIWSGSFSASLMLLEILRNSVRIAQDLDASTAAVRVGLQASTEAKFNAGDSVRVLIYQNSGVPQPLSSSSLDAHFSVTLIR